MSTPRGFIEVTHKSDGTLPFMYPLEQEESRLVATDHVSEHIFVDLDP